MLFCFRVEFKLHLYFCPYESNLQNKSADREVVFPLCFSLSFEMKSGKRMENDWPRTLLFYQLLSGSFI